MSLSKLQLFTRPIGAEPISDEYVDFLGLEETGLVTIGAVCASDGCYLVFIVDASNNNNFGDVAISLQTQGTQRAAIVLR